uniref:Cysteine and tyrosine-rich protein 1 n=2 Tax=Ciona intestinalis TaxID=7719 RepID=F6XF25_CIOIN
MYYFTCAVIFASLAALGDAVGKYCSDLLDCPGSELCCSNNLCCDFETSISSTVTTISIGVIVAIVVGILLCIGGCIAACVCCCKRNQPTYHNPPVVTTTTVHTQQPVVGVTNPTGYAHVPQNAYPPQQPPYAPQPYPSQSAYPPQPQPHPHPQPYPS